ncbi:MAG: hypothetical protein H0W76_23045 [Pyrinomonadaceae bacterium]|nr:hypothetical protein [Pyrinomonadaceae bacterium]
MATHLAIAVETSCGPPPATANLRAHTKAQLTLTEAAAVSSIPVHMLKAAIYSGALPATRHTRCVVQRVDLDGWLRVNGHLREP